MDFTGRSVLVPGAASGIGLATAQLLSAQGARLILGDVDAAALARVDLPGERFPGDVRDEAYWDALSPHLDCLDHAVVNAGVAGAGSIAGLALADWQRILSVNLDGAFLTLRAAMRAMKRRGGSIVAAASAAGTKAEAGVAA